MKRVLPLCVTLVALFQCSPYSTDRPDGERLFQVHCASCHGANGEGGRGPSIEQTLTRVTTHGQLVKVIRGGIPGTEMPGSRLNEDEIREIAAWVRALGKVPPEKVAGDARRGQQIYRAAGRCADCHMISGWGGALGPDLTDIGLRRSLAYLRAAVLDPAADLPNNLSAIRSDVRIPQNFLQVTLETQDGRKLTGIRINEDAFSIQLRDLSGRMHSFYKHELLELRTDQGESPMPAYRGVFSVQELDDLVAYLASLRG
jgi:putative heme-binding domain-containing protein